MSEEQTKYQVPTVERSPAALMMVAIEKGLDLDKVEKAMALQERWEANEARKAYHDAMAGFKAAPPEIEKDRHVKFQTSKGMTEYHHASLANVTTKINSALSAHGLSAGWKVAQDAERITVTCTITHRLGHSESTSLSASPDDSGSKNSIQAIGSTISYLSRYTLLCLTGLATADQDDDGQSTVTDQVFIDSKQTEIINKWIKEVGADRDKFLQYMKSESVEKIAAANYDKAITSLKEKKKENEKKAAQTRQPGEEG